MPDIIGNDKKKFDKKKLLLGGGALLVVAVVLYMLMGPKNDNVAANVTNANTVGVLDNQNDKYDGATKKVDEDVKATKTEDIKKKRETAAEKKTTQIESVPIDSEYKKDDVNTNIDTLLTAKVVPCMTVDYDEFGYHCKTGLDRQGYDREGYDKNGFNKQGCNREGMDINGKPCGAFLNPVKNECLEKLMNKECNGDENLYDESGYDKDGYDRQGYDRQGFNRDGCDRQGYDKEGFSCTTKMNRNGFDRNGCDKDGYDKEGFSCSTKLSRDGFDKEGYDKDGFNLEGCNREGFTREGKSCKGKGTKVSLSPDEKIWYSNMLASKTAYFRELDKNQKEFSVELEVIRDGQMQSNILAAAEAEKVKNDKDNSIADNSDKTSDTKPLNNADIEIPTGTMLYGQILAGINSDYPGMVRAKVLGGPLDQSQMIGSYAVPFLEDSYRPRDKIKINFDKLIYNRNTIAISAVGLDTQSMTDYLSGDVNNHYFTRWGGLIAANVLKGIGKAVANTNTTASNDGSGMIYSAPITATGDQLKVAAGEVGNELSTIAREQFDRPPTVTKDQGEMIAIFFMAELNDDRIPMIFNSREVADLAEKSKLNPNTTIK